MPSGLFYLNSLDQSISSLRVSVQFLLLPCFIGMSVINANSVDPDHTPRSANLLLSPSAREACECVPILPAAWVWHAVVLERTSCHQNIIWLRNPLSQSCQSFVSGVEKFLLY